MHGKFLLKLELKKEKSCRKKNNNYLLIGSQCTKILKRSCFIFFNSSFNLIIPDPIDGETSTLAKDLEQVQRAIRGESRSSLHPTR